MFVKASIRGSGLGILPIGSVGMIIKGARAIVRSLPKSQLGELKVLFHLMAREDLTWPTQKVGASGQNGER
jgi:hypothetical protein